MAIWIPYKAKPHELKNNRKNERPRLCKVCGKQIHGGHDLCKTCDKFIQNKRSEERKAKA